MELFLILCILSRRKLELALAKGWKKVDSGLKDELVLGDPDAPRFVLWQGKLRPVPSGPADLLFFDLMSFRGKLRAGFGAMGLRPPPPIVWKCLFHNLSNDMLQSREESVEEFVRRNLGDEIHYIRDKLKHGYVTMEFTSSEFITSPSEAIKEAYDTEVG
eukprot:Gb_09338 [translate_table: standard]